MPGGLGVLGYVGLAPESSGGVAVAATAFMPALSEDLSLEIERYELKNIHNALSMPDDQAGLRRVEGAVSGVFDPVVGGHLLKGSIGSATVASLGGGLWRHSFKQTSLSQWDGRFALQPYTFEIFRDVGSAQQYGGCQIDELTLSLAPNGALTFEAGIIGISMANKANVAASYSTFPFLAFDACSITIAGAADINIESFEFSFTNNLEGIATLSNRNTVAKIRRSDVQDPRLNLTIGFEDITHLLRFTDQTELPIRIFAVSGSYSLLIDMPRVVYTAFPLGMDGRGRQTVDVAAMCRFSQGSGTAYEIQLTTSVGSY